MTQNLSFLIAFSSGLLTFLSPCVLPLIPSFLFIIGSSPAGENDENRPNPVARTLSYILGFSAVFIVFSIVFSATFNLMSGAFRYINIVSGLIVIILGFNVLFNFLSILNYEKIIHLKNKPKGIIGAFLAGGAFGAGWTPCVGPILASILLLAANSGSVPLAVIYLVFFSVGLGLPFLLASIFYDAFLKVSKKLRSFLPLIQRVCGILLILTGILILSGRYQVLSIIAAQFQNRVLPQSGQAVSPAVSTTGKSDNTESKITRLLMEAGIQVAAEDIDIIDFTLPLLDGTDFTLSEQKGRVIFLNFWATWCGPCRVEMPSMEAVYQKLKSKGFEIVAVNLGESKDMVSSFMNEYNLNFPAALDTRGFTGSIYNVQAIPTTYIVDRRGLIVARLVGSIDWNTPKVTAALEALLE
jgi:cytochrome c-type biogenesis protein